VTLVPTDPEGYPEWGGATAFGTTGQWGEPEPGEYWLVVGGPDALAEPIVRIEKGDRLTVDVRLVPTASVECGMARVPAGEYAYPRQGYGGRSWSFRVRSFLMDRTEVSIGRFLRYLEESGTEFAGWQDGPPPAELHGRPMTNLTRDEAEAYAAWVGKRLPTRNEWRAAFLAGSDEDPALGNVGPEAELVDVDAPWPDTTPLGIRHLQGNASEWIRTWFVPDVSRSDSPLLRTAAWYMGSFAGMQHEARRDIPLSGTSPPGLASTTRGFRCARSLTPPD
jgi:formylglycine-generating enzyme required for sulfatase activity